MQAKAGAGDIACTLLAQMYLSGHALPYQTQTLET